MNPFVLSSYTVVVALISLLVGVITQITNTGKLFGQFTVPPTAMVWLTIVGPFLAGTGASLTQSGALTAATAFTALVAGVAAVIAGSAPGLAVSAAMHAHFVVPQKAAAMRAALRAAPTNDNSTAAPPQKAA